MAPRGKKRRTLSSDEAALWRRVTSTAEPLGERGPSAPEAAEAETEGAAEEAPTPRSKRASKAGPATVPDAPPPAKQAPLPELRPGASPGLDKRIALRLKRGQLKVEARIDLHGLTQSEAHAALNHFIADSYQAGRRCVLVITGKGSVRDPGGGVLRQMTPRWLNQAALRRKVLALEQAQARHGGGGALYVLLKRQR